ncbi:hypothetical protein VOLCADRAFT_90641 [Volvox carteri f. nagariensis]|uniref:Uncharacterized protein n=1 Tax=Volvox carteri f. nagariensis TaxID=3068 RepID=D8TUY3_VOLCA|nr:uncharacterized protein VOLCADRAFT_90641 [Volvox carteri f. nagariensis]EFJ48793.1 hypothetical protein VOLCADRAFT_90641 [Volvox carteri f. nagariensis]|eukprot:XP_002950125.1 hypothetical protein VOLCADRAFT_90641 [Volvox carteri f. nagariensis]
MYGGLLLAGFGLAVLTRNETRLAILALLWWVLENKVASEEKALLARYPEYAEYKAKVKKSTHSLVADGMPLRRAIIIPSKVTGILPTQQTSKPPLFLRFTRNGPLPPIFHNPFAFRARAAVQQLSNGIIVTESAHHLNHIT